MAEREILGPVKFKQPGWPSYWGPQALKDQEGLIKGRAFERGFRQKPQSSEDLIFPSLADDYHNDKQQIIKYGLDWRRLQDAEREDYDEVKNKKNLFYVDPDWPRYIGCDLSGKARRGTVIFTIALSPSGIRHVLDIRIGSWGAGPEFVRQLRKVDDTILLKPRRIFVENNAIQEAVIDNIKEMGGDFANKVHPFRTGNNKMDPVIGLPGIDVQFSERRWKIAVPHKKNVPSHPDKKNPTLCICGICEYIRDATTVTSEDIASNNTPDTVAAHFIAKEASRHGQKYSDTSAQIVKLSQQDIQHQVDRMLVPENARSLRLPTTMDGRPFYGTNKTSRVDFGRGNAGQRLPHPDGTRHEKGDCASCDSFR